MAAGRRFYTLETRAHRDGYTLKDIEGKCDEEGGYFDEDSGEWKPGTWEKEGYLEILKTGFEDDDLWRRCKVLVPDIDVRPSNDAGRYLCDFIYYASLTWFWKQRGEGGGKGQRGGSGDGDGEGKRGAGGCGGKNGGPVMFLHVPGESEPEDIERGREVAIALIRGMVLSWMSDKGE